MRASTLAWCGPLGKLRVQAIDLSTDKFGHLLVVGKLMLKSVHSTFLSFISLLGNVLTYALNGHVDLVQMAHQKFQLLTMIDILLKAIRTIRTDKLVVWQYI